MTTGIVALVVIWSKFAEGAWLVIVAIPLLVLAFLGINRHYRRFARRLKRRRRAPCGPPRDADEPGAALGRVARRRHRRRALVRADDRQRRADPRAARAGQAHRSGHSPALVGLRAGGAEARDPRRPRRAACRRCSRRSGGCRAASPISSPSSSRSSSSGSRSSRRPGARRSGSSSGSSPSRASSSPTCRSSRRSAAGGAHAEAASSSASCSRTSMRVRCGRSATRSRSASRTSAPSRSPSTSEDADRFRGEWQRAGLTLPLDLSDAPYRDIGTPLRAYIRELTADPGHGRQHRHAGDGRPGLGSAAPQPAGALHQAAAPLRAARDPLVGALPAVPLVDVVLRRRATAAETEQRPRARPRRARALRDRLRQRRLVDLLRARPDRRDRARPHADRLHHQRPDLRRDGGDLRRGHRSLPGGRRLVELRAARVQRARLVRRGLGPDAQLRDHRRDLGDLRPALPVDLLGAAADEPVGHHRRDRPHLAARRHQHRRDQGGGEPQHLPGGDRLRDAAPARRSRLLPDLPPARAAGERPPRASRRPGARSCSRSRWR